ncbi:MAG: bifunctional glycosyltransferase family 2/GtrA family protein [Lachnospiraceae bacterium]|nr:bifunctional glycosyltransferase family 2/GtrA family protein [Lachnospiraceae bacterium]
MKIPIIIPAYEPDERFIELLSALVVEDNYIVVIDDGSGEKYRPLFDQVNEIIDGKGVLLRHEVNKGKGRALKTAFRYVLNSIPDAIGAVTADSDGQHTKDCIMAVCAGLEKHPNSLILGVRHFDEEDIPWKSRFGNTLTLKVMKIVSGLSISDTQTGLRGIPRKFMEELLNVEGERYEYETRMLLETVNKYSIVEVPIKTIYDSKENHQTHFHPFRDSFKIYKVLFERFFRFVFSSFSSFIIDIVLFYLLCIILKPWNSSFYAAAATVIARIASATCNYSFNYIFVFRSKEKKLISAGKYLALAVVQMGCSALLVTLAIHVFPYINESILKMIVDTALFFVSYQIQKRFVFGGIRHA